jgi:hypothetical protein
MNKTESPINMDKLAARADLEDRISLIRGACEIFRRGFDGGVFTFKELKGACSFVGTLIQPFDWDAGDLCLLASHAENREQFRFICSMSRQQWRSSEAVDERRERLWELLT